MSLKMYIRIGEKLSIPYWPRIRSILQTLKNNKYIIETKENIVD